MISAWSREGVSERPLPSLTGWLTGDVLREIYAIDLLKYCMLCTQPCGMLLTVWESVMCAGRQVPCCVC